MAIKIFITGASSGIGEHLAYEYSRQGAVLGLASRRIELLENVADKCRDLGAEVFIYQLDVKRVDACQQIAEKFIHDADGIDIVIANAGISGNDGLNHGDVEKLNNILNTNILGVSNSFAPFIPKMKDQSRGSIVVISSIAGFMGLPGRGGYSASKAAIRFLMDSWRYIFKKYGINLITICPGFIETPMTEKHKFKMPFLMKPDVAAKKIIHAIDKNIYTYIFPWQWRLVLPLLRLIPPRIIAYFS